MVTNYTIQRWYNLDDRICSNDLASRIIMSTCHRLLEPTYQVKNARAMIHAIDKRLKIKEDNEEIGEICRGTTTGNVTAGAHLSSAVCFENWSSKNEKNIAEAMLKCVRSLVFSAVSQMPIKARMPYPNDKHKVIMKSSIFLSTAGPESVVSPPSPIFGTLSLSSSHLVNHLDERDFIKLGILHHAAWGGLSALIGPMDVGLEHCGSDSKTELAMNVGLDFFQASIRWRVQVPENCLFDMQARLRSLYSSLQGFWSSVRPTAALPPVMSDWESMVHACDVT
ncbi:hypothetical protein Tco_1078716 [Tanacetum coccineum]|uniref:Uncharacterized protein n=1 Tax=Tanacetum coccineum TaxID=301880 RepID=A0ABQ5HPS5_9ASTR